jgi:hypothetical protein
MKTRILLSLLILTAYIVAPWPLGRVESAPTSFSIFSTPQNLGPSTDGDENSPFIAPNGLSMYFSGQRSGTIGGGDIWVSRRPTPFSAWGPAENLGPVINTAGNDNTPTLSLDGKTMFFNSDRTDLGGIGGQDIYMTTRTNASDDFGWTTPINLGPNINTTGNDGGAAYFEDPATGTAALYFVAIRSGGFGDLDIYQSLRLPGGSFLAPQNVTSLNSPAREARPSIRRDGLEMFFTSDRAGGVGGIDIYVSTRASIQSPWNAPVNVVALNTATTDGAPTHSPDGSAIYFSSPRAGGSGRPDLYSAVRMSINRSPAGDFNGDSRSDISVFRPADGTWHILHSGTNTYQTMAFGVSGDRPVASDYDGDGRVDVAVFDLRRASGG